MSRMLLSAAALSVALSAILAGAVGAQTYETREMHVSVDKIDFNNPRQVRQLYARIHAYAELVCHSDAPNEPLIVDEQRACERAAVSDAVRHVNREELTRLDAGERGEATQMAYARDGGARP